MSEPEISREQLLRLFLETHGLAALNPRDLDQALTHRSYAYEMGLSEDNERLEFLGDAFIAAISSEFLCEADPAAKEGILSKRRSHLVSRRLLGHRAEEIGLGKLLLLGRGERDTGGARRLSTLGSALEALVGIIYLRLGFDISRDFVRMQILHPLLHFTPADHSHGDYKSTLQEWAQQQHKTVPRYIRVAESGPDHEKQFLVRVEVAGEILGEGTGNRIKIAENEAARKALEIIKVT